MKKQSALSLGILGFILSCLSFTAQAQTPWFHMELPTGASNSVVNTIPQENRSVFDMNVLNSPDPTTGYSAPILVQSIKVD